MPKMNDDDLSSIIRQQEHAALSWTNSELSKDRARALDYYLGKPFGNEVEGRSQVISTDVFDTVEGMLPSLIEIFTASNQIAECEPQGMEDIPEAKQQTVVANHVLFKQNNASLIFYTWFKDALLQKNGVVKYYYDDQKNEFRTESYQNLTQVELVKIASDEYVEVVSAVEKELFIAEQPMMVYDVTLKVYTKRGRVKVVNVAPENFLVTTRQTSIDLQDCEFCEHREKKTKTDLLEMGFTEDELSDLGVDDIGMEATEEAIARTENYANILDDDRTDEPMKQYDCADVYIVIDYDGDGVAELRHVFKAGKKILINEETDHIPFAVISPILLPHQFYGLSVADITMDVQLNKSVIHRQQLDSLYLANNPRVTVIEGQVEIEDVITSRPGGVIRARSPNAVTPWVMPFVGREAFPMLEYWEGVKENRTGVTRYNQGLDADSLNKTAHGISQIMTAAQKRQELIARIFAETGVKALVRGILHCIAKSGMKSLVVKLTNQYVNIDPRQWKNQYDVTINVALGSGTKDRQIQLLNMLSAKQIEMMQTGRSYMVSDQNQFNLASKLSEACGFKSPELFFTDPQLVPQEVKQPPPSIDTLKLQLNEKLKVMDMQVTAQQTDKKLQVEREIEIAKARIDQETKLAVAQLQKDAQENVATVQADTQKRTTMAQAMLEDHKMRGQADMKVYEKQMEMEKPVEVARVMQSTMDQSLTQVMQAIIEGQKQTAEALQALALSNDQIARIMLAPRKMVKDAKGNKQVEIQGFGNVPVQ
jgi:hypothetical protein